ncbi:unnamed protein product [Owenia fusiformis]|uniref:Uncharacterized protein n=1 Tax=Owenia fusiformis TaxID=6347 RepID=A0A8J1XMT8_OWEFU|nr:unnamed protein product [Owenia fusiformis]
MAVPGQSNLKDATKLFERNMSNDSNACNSLDSQESEDSQNDIPAVCPVIWSVLDFNIRDNPPWLPEGQTIPIKRVIEDIIMYKSEYDMFELSKKDPELLKRKLKDIRDEFIYRMAVEEKVGVQELGASSEVLQDHLNSVDNPKKFRRQFSQEQQETMNMYSALRHFTNNFREMKKTGLIDEQYVLDGHKKLMANTMKIGGKFSENPRETEYKGEVHEYPKSDVIPKCHQAIVDNSNQMMEYIRCAFDNNTEEKILYTVKLAAWLLYNYVSLHPFGDGNGRTCRLLCSYIISTIAPFPTPI